MFPNSTLVMYEGGGYDGCIYEWNYAFIDNDGCFHDIASTGYKGCDTLEKLVEYYENRPSNFDLYSLPSEANRFGDEAPISHLIGVARWFADNFPEVIFDAKCDECGERCNVLEEHGEGIHGVGGVVQEYRRILCGACDTE